MKMSSEIQFDAVLKHGEKSKIHYLDQKYRNMQGTIHK